MPAPQMAAQIQEARKALRASRPNSASRKGDRGNAGVKRGARGSRHTRRGTHKARGSSR